MDYKILILIQIFSHYFQGLKSFKSDSSSSTVKTTVTMTVQTTTPGKTSYSTCKAYYMEQFQSLDCSANNVLWNKVYFIMLLYVGETK